jgi:DNA ligase-1
MRDFAHLLDRLVLTPQRNVKLKLLTDYFRATPDPDRGYALAALAGDLNLASVKPAMLRGLVTERIDEILFHYSYDYIGDLAETIALIWPDAPPGGKHGAVSPVVSGGLAFEAATRSDPAVHAGMVGAATSPALSRRKRPPPVLPL